MVTAHDLCRIPGFKEGDGARRYMHGDHRPTRGGGPGRGLARVAAGAARLDDRGEHHRDVLPGERRATRCLAIQVAIGERRLPKMA
jgi:hypothetical protein